MLIAYRDGEQHMMYVQLEPAKDESGDYYRVNTAFPVRQSDYPEKHGFKEVWPTKDGSEPATSATGQQSAFAADQDYKSSPDDPNARGDAGHNKKSLRQPSDQVKTQEAINNTDKGIALFSKTDKSAGTTLLSNATNTGSGRTISPHDANETFARIVGKWNKASPAFLHDTFASAPDYVQQAIRDSSGNEKTGGVYVNGEVHVIRDNHESVDALERTLYHEGNHSGIIRELNKNAMQKLQQAGIALGGEQGMRKIASQYGLADRFDGYVTDYAGNSQKQAILVAELSALLSERHVFQTLPMRIRRVVMQTVGAIRSMLRNSGLVKLSSMGESDMLQMVSRANARLTKSGNGEAFAPALRSNDNDAYRGEPLETWHSDTNLADAAKEFFGVTNRPLEAGYVLPDGSMLDLSGRHESDKSHWPYLRDQRNVDHRMLFGENADGFSMYDLLETNGGSEGMHEFMARTGAVRVDFRSAIVSAMRPLTQTQLNTVARHIGNDYAAASYVDGETGRIIADTEWDKVSREAIKRFFTENRDKKPDAGSALFSKTDKAAERKALPPVDQSIIDSLIAGINGVRQAAGDARITTVFSPSELSADVLEQADKQGIPHDEIAGFLYKGHATIVRQNIKSRQEAEETLLHEIIGHGGANALLGEAKAPVLLEAFERAGGIGGIRTAALRLGVLKQLNQRIPAGKLSDVQKVQVVDEMLALAQGQSGTVSGKLRQLALEWWNKFRNGLIAALDKAGFTDTARRLDKFDAGEAAAMLRQMREAVTNGGDIGGHGVQFMVAWHGSRKQTPYGDIQYPVSADQSAAERLNRGMVGYFNDASWENAYVQSELPDALSGIREAIESGFGVQVAAIQPTARRFNVFNGINYGGTNFINLNANTEFINTVGHELYHDLERDRPDLHQWFREQASQYYQGLDAYKDKLNALLLTGEKPYTTKKAESELLADFTGDALRDPQFVAQLAEDNPGKFKRLFKAITDWLKSVADKLTKKGLGSSQYFNDVDALRKHLNRVLLAYAGNKRIEEVLPPKFSRETTHTIESFKQALQSIPGAVGRAIRKLVDDKTINLITDAQIPERIKQGGARFSEDNEVATSMLYRALADNDALFQSPKSDAIHLQQVFEDVAAGTVHVERVENPESEMSEQYHIYPISNGKILREQEGDVNVYLDGKVEISVATWDEGYGGSSIYSAVGNWAYNTGLKFAGDRKGITPVGILRRLENMISLAVKFGTTDHIAPHPNQMRELGFKWKDGDFDYNLEQMLQASYNVIRNGVYVTETRYGIDLTHKSPNAIGVSKLDDLEYDFEHGRFIEKSTGKQFTDGQFKLLASSRGARATNAGRATLKRAVIAHTIMGEPNENRVRLGLIRRLSNQFGSTQLAKTFYSKSGAIRAYVDPLDGKAYIVADNIPKSWGAKEITGLIEHEVAVHIMHLGKSDAEFKDILKAADNMRKMGSKSMQEARNHVPDDTSAENILEEQFAYFIEANPKHSLTRRFIAWFRNMLRKVGFNIAYSENDLIQMARSALLSAGNALNEQNSDNTLPMREKVSAGLPLLSRAPKQGKTKSTARHPHGETHMQYIQRLYQDDLAIWERLQDRIKEEGGTVTDAEDVRSAMNRFPSRYRNRILKFKQDTYYPLIDRLAKLDTDINQLGRYMLALHAREGNAYIASINEKMPDGGVGMTNKEADLVIAEAKRRDDFKEFDALARDFQKITAH